MAADNITPFVFDSLPVRGALIGLSRAWRRMLRDHDYEALVRDTLGHAAAATGLIAQSLKFDGAITLQIQGGAGLQMLVMQCTGDLELRGMASADATAAAGSFADLVHGAHCAITVDAGERPYQGIVEMAGSSLADSLENYFARSVQVPTHVALVSNESMSGGILLQQMPGQSGLDEDDWNRLGYLAATLTSGDFEADGGLALIGKLFAEDDVRVFEPRPVVFRCRCSRRRTEEILRMLGETETREVLAERGRVDVTCEYCGRLRSFDPIDVAKLFDERAVSGPDSLQ